jgi:hypothetical protein
MRVMRVAYCFLETPQYFGDLILTKQNKALLLYSLKLHNIKI